MKDEKNHLSIARREKGKTGREGRYCLKGKASISKKRTIAQSRGESSNSSRGGSPKRKKKKSKNPLSSEGGGNCGPFKTNPLITTKGA